MGGFGFGPRRGPAFVGPSTPSLAAISPWQCSGPTLPAVCPPAPIAVQGPREPTLIDGFYSDLPPPEIGFLRREARVAFSTSARFDNDDGTIFRIAVPTAQTIVVTGLEFYADPPDGQIGARFVAGDLRGIVAFGLLFNDHSPINLYAEIDAPGAVPDPSGIVRGSFFSGVGHAFGGPAETPHLALRAREGTQVRVTYASLRPSLASIGHVGAILRGFVVPSAIYERNAP